MSYLDIAFGATLGGDVQGPYGNNTVYQAPWCGTAAAHC